MFLFAKVAIYTGPHSINCKIKLHKGKITSCSPLQHFDINYILYYWLVILVYACRIAAICIQIKAVQSYLVLISHICP